MCQILKVSRSGYYEWLKRKELPKKTDYAELDIIEEFYQSKETYGFRRLKEELEKHGKKINHKKIRKVMKKYNLIPKHRRIFKVTTDSNHSYPISPNVLNRDFTCTRPNEKWVSDITYIATNEGWLYLAAIVDLYTKKVVGWALDKRMTKELVLKALEQAYKHERPKEGLILHSDRGSQYASYAYRNKVKSYGMIQSMSRKGNCWDNACAESFFSTLKIELIYGEKYRTRAEAKLEIIEYIEMFYNSKRLHSSLEYVSPIEYEKNYYALLSVA